MLESLKFTWTWGTRENFLINFSMSCFFRGWTFWSITHENIQEINVELWMTGFKAWVLKKKMNVALSRDIMKTSQAKISLAFFASVFKISAHKHGIKHERSLIKNSKKEPLALLSAGFSSSFYTRGTANLHLHFKYILSLFPLRCMHTMLALT